MISHTHSFQTLKDQTQETLDFAVLVSYAVPFLKHKLKDSEETYLSESANSSEQSGRYEKQPMPFRPETFDGRKVVVGKIRDSALGYKREIAKTLRLTSFSYFEAYIGDVLNEIIAFHGGEPFLLKRQAPTDLLKLSPDQLRALNKLKEPPAKGKEGKYKKALKQLDGAAIAFPHQALVRSGLLRLKHRSKSYRAVEIPILLSELLGFEFASKDQMRFGDLREARNRIAHGNAEFRDMELKTALNDNEFLRSLALEIDSHVLSSWMVVDPIIYIVAST
jgi:hypothetical protein